MHFIFIYSQHIEFADRFIAIFIDRVDRSESNIEMNVNHV